MENCAPLALLISNGEFVSFHGPDPTMVRVEAANSGSVRFVNCAFWGPCNQIAKIAGTGTVGFSDCTFVHWDRNDEGRPALQVAGGTVLVRGCEFQADKPQVELGREGAAGGDFGQYPYRQTPHRQSQQGGGEHQQQCE